MRITNSEEDTMSWWDLPTIAVHHQQFRDGYSDFLQELPEGKAKIRKAADEEVTRLDPGRGHDFYCRILFCFGILSCMLADVSLLVNALFSFHFDEI